MSKALVISNKMISTLLPEANSFRIRWSGYKRLDVVEREGRNPN